MFSSLITPTSFDGLLFLLWSFEMSFSTVPYIGENPIMQNASTQNGITTLFHLSWPLVFCPWPSANIIQNEYFFFHQARNLRLFLKSPKHILFSRPQVKNGKMRPEHAEILGPWLFPCSHKLTFPSYPNCQTPKLLHPFILLPFTRLHLTFSGMKLPRNIGYYVNFSFWPYFILKPRPASRGFLRLRCCSMRSNNSSIEFLVEGS